MMKYAIEFDIPDNETTRKSIKTDRVQWRFLGYGGYCMAQPVIHAHWNEFSDYSGTCYAECSRCGLLWWIEEGTAEENEMFYCPKCGARMDGGHNDG